MLPAIIFGAVVHVVATLLCLLCKSSKESGIKDDLSCKWQSCTQGEVIVGCNRQEIPREIEIPAEGPVTD